MAGETQGRKELLVSIGLIVLFAVLTCSPVVPPVEAQARELAGGRTTLRAVIPDDVPPTYFQDPKTHKPAGFAVDVMDEIAGRAGLSVVYTFEEDWPAIIAAVRSGRADIAPALGMSGERTQILAFTTPVETVPVSLFVRSDNTTISELKPGIAVGVMRGSAAYDAIKKQYSSDVALKNYEHFSEGLFDLLAGQIDVFCCPATTLRLLARNAGVEDRIKIVGTPLMELKRGIAMRKDDVDLFAKLNAVAEEFVGSPEYQRIYTKWYGRTKPYFTLSKQNVQTIIVIALIIIAMASWRHRSMLGVNRRLLQSEAVLKESQNIARIGRWELDLLNNSLRWSDTIFDIFEIDQTQFGATYEAFLETIHPDDREPVNKAYTDSLKNKQPYDVTHRLLMKDGRVKWVSEACRTDYNPQGQAIQSVGIVQDITERKLAEEALRESEKRYHILFDQSPDGILLIDSEGKILEFNDAAHRQLKYSREEFAQLRLFDLDPVESPDEIRGSLRKIQEMGQARFDVKHRTKQGEVRDVYVIAQAMILSERPVVHTIWHDITERKKAEELILRSLKEKEVLLKEIHHRVKNNMQVISSLLNLQARNIADATIRAMFEDARNRVNSMALIHRKLYQSEDLAHIDFNEYLRGLVADIADTYKRDDVVLSVDLEPIVLDVNVAIPCGLIANELVSNSLKYAFPGGKKGTITIGLGRDGKGNHVLTVADNGVGFPETVDFRNTASLGLQLVNMLTGQIYGTLELSRAEGTAFRITFPHEESV